MDAALDAVLGGMFTSGLYKLGMFIWNSVMLLVADLAGTTPMAFSSGAWHTVTANLYPYTLTISAALMNIFFFAGVFKTVSNLHQSITLEMMIEIFIRLIACNALLHSGLYLMRTIFNITALMCQGLLVTNNLSISQQEVDIGTAIFYFIMGIVFFLVAFVCSIMILIAVYGRYLQLYILVVAMPLAIATIPAGGGVSQTAAAWAKTFIGKSLEIFVIILVLALTSAMYGSIDFLNAQNGIGDWFDGFILSLQNMFLMVIVTAEVKGADSFIRRTFGL